jgi:hypothetical protein
MQAKELLTAEVAKRIRDRNILHFFGRKHATRGLSTAFGSRLTPLNMTRIERVGLAAEFAEEFALVHMVLEGLAAINEHDGHFIGKLASELFVGVDVDFLPAEQAAALQLDQTLFDDLTEMAALARVDHDMAEDVHERECSRFKAVFNWTKCKEV